MKPLSFNEPPATDAKAGRRTGTSRSRTPWLIALVVVIALAIWAAIGFFGKRDKAAPPPSAVQATLAPVEQKDFAVYIAGTGNVMPNQSVTVKARVDGQLQMLGYKEGQDVKAGQLIAQIDPRPFRAQLEQAAATRGRDAATLANARLDLKRYEELIKEEATSQQQLDTQKALVMQLEATVKTDDAQVSYARTQLDYTTITAPISGRTGLRLVDVGNIVHAADTTGLVVIDQIDPISVVFTLPDAAFQRVNAAMRTSAAPLEAVAYSRDESGGPLANGKLVLVDNHIDTTSGTVQIKATFDNARHVLWPGQYVNIHLYIETRHQALLIPSAGVQRSQKGTYAFVVDADDKAQMQPIDVALFQDGQALIDKGLKAGQRVVVDGQYKVKPGVKIAATPAGAATAGQAPAPSAANPASATSDAADKSAPEKGK
jgi:multidrug efflux system membrane fusion protein